MTPRGGAALMIVLLLSSTSCASRSSGTSIVVGNVTTPIAPRLTILPAGATFAWVPPATLLDKLEAADEASAESGVFFGLRTEISTLVRAHAWREASPVDADYLLTLLRIQRGIRGQASDLPTVRAPTSGDLPPCRGDQGEAKNVNCRSMASRSEDRRGKSWVTYVIRRRRDGAQFTMAIPVEPYSNIADVPFVDRTLRLLLAREP